MQFVFLAAYKVLGIIMKPGQADVTLFEQPDRSLTVSLTADLDTHFHFLDRQTAIAFMLLSGGIQQPLQVDFPSQLSDRIDAIRNQRRPSIDGGAVVVACVRGELDASVTEPKRDVTDFILCFDAYDKKELSARVQPVVASALAGLRIGGGRSYEFERIASGSYLVDDDGRIVHSFSVELNPGRAYVSSPLNEEQTNHVRESIGLLTQSSELARVAGLYAQSIDRGTDNFRAFVSAWSALEILIGKLFPIYHRELAAQLAGVSAAPGLKAYLARVTDVMSGKHSLADRFAVISMFLDDTQDLDEIDRFRSIKSVRDRLSHGEAIPDATLPTREVQKFFDKYLANHIRRNA